jgi:hypothetical protein
MEQRGLAGALVAQESLTVYNHEENVIHPPGLKYFTLLIENPPYTIKTTHSLIKTQHNAQPESCHVDVDGRCCRSGGVMEGWRQLRRKER